MISPCWRWRPAPETATRAHSRAEVGTMNRLMQNVNIGGTSFFMRIALYDQPLALPHISVPDISWLDWSALAAAGFQACVFDKDNTLTEPFAMEVEQKLQASLAACRLAFDGRMALYSNSAGLQQYDPQGTEAAALETALGVAVLRHTDKKPLGGCEELREQLGCDAHDVVFVGDRYLTDVVYGNRHGMLTVRVAPLSRRGEPPGVVLARSVEEACVARWAASGVKPPPHPRLAAVRSARFVRAPADDGL